ncbi:Plant-drug/metabolite exporter [Parasponia andersonii]|uniref:WAT1-related protein n=1 Tax=Parasponia andersonii TaxID=3476 RepID=A0A2P5BI06_PARAD|nr:Plant-drug/metabolite exporter [Parasponia andersonii]
MGGMARYKAVIAMVVLQCITAAVTLVSKVALSQGMSPIIFVVYRQVFATIIMAPVAYFTRRRNPHNTSLRLRSFTLILLTSLIGVTANNSTYFEGLNLSSSTIATAMLNLIPAITFVMATVVGMEKIYLRSIAKITGTIVCITGGICMALVKGPELFIKTKFVSYSKSVFFLGTGLEGENLPLGCLFLFINCCCNSFWIVMQVPISEACPDHLYTTFWMFFLSSIQSSILACFIDRNPQAWALHSVLQLGSCLFAAIGEAVSFFIQVWCISRTGPVFAVMFTPLSTVIATIIAILFMGQSLYIGSLVGAFAVILGLYVVLWGKAEDLEEIIQYGDHGQSLDTVNIVDESSYTISCKIDLKVPLLTEK